MIMLDKWDALESDGRYDKHTVGACRELASDMCREIFDRMGLDVQPIENALRVSGRGLTYLFPTRDKVVTSRALDPPRIKLTPHIRNVLKVRARRKSLGVGESDD